jgi:ubiquinone/menaquinone biosynthesis C-methylase UbiE
MSYKTGTRYVQKQYRTDTNLNKRIQIHRYSTNTTGWAPWLFDMFGCVEGMNVLEVGCGNGWIWREKIESIPKSVSVVLGDISAGMIAKARENLCRFPDVVFGIFDAESIPFDDDSFDIVVANHMLYHVADLDSTLREIRRVLRNTGTLYASTIGRDHLRELNGWIRRFDIPCDLNSEKLSRNFGLENGESILNNYFRRVEKYIYEDNLRIPSIDPVFEFISSLETSVPIRPVHIAPLRDYLENMIRETGAICIRKSTGLFAAGI